MNKHERVAAAMADIETRGWALKLENVTTPSGAVAHTVTITEMPSHAMELMARMARAKREPLIGFGVAITRLDQGEGILACHAAAVAAHKQAALPGTDLTDAPVGIAAWLQSVPVVDR